MRKLLLAASALALASPVASFAAPTISVVGGFGPMAIPAINNFKSELMGAGFTQYTTSSNLFLTGMAKITYYYMGSESGFFNRFTAGSSSYTETSGGYETKWLSPVLIGTQTYATGGSLAGLLGFSSASVGGLPSPLGSDGFGVFLTAGKTTGYSTIYFGYDDERSRPDDNHDDFIVKAVITAVPVPEPGTWAMLLSGFAIVGSLLRRRRSNGVTVLA
jgi:hypothetical protein